MFTQLNMQAYSPTGRDRHALPPSITAQNAAAQQPSSSTRFADNPSVEQCLLTLPRTAVDTHFFGPTTGSSLHDRFTWTSPFVLVGEEPDEGELRLRRHSHVPRFVENGSPVVGEFEEYHPDDDEIAEWRDNIADVEQDQVQVAVGKRKLSRLSAGIVDIGQKVARKVSNVSQT